MFLRNDPKYKHLTLQQRVWLVWRLPSVFEEVMQKLYNIKLEKVRLRNVGNTNVFYISERPTVYRNIGYVNKLYSFIRLY